MSIILYVGAGTDTSTFGGEPVVAYEAIRLLRIRGHTVITDHSSLQDGFGLYRKFIRMNRRFRSEKDYEKFKVKYYANLIKKYDFDVIISQYDYDSSIITAATKTKKALILYVHSWQYFCPKTDLFDSNARMCEGYKNKNCKNCILESDYGNYRKYGLHLLLNNLRLYKKMENRMRILLESDARLVVPSEKLKQRFLEHMVNTDHIDVVENVLAPLKNEDWNNFAKQNIITYIGSSFKTKGFEDFEIIAHNLKLVVPHIRFIAIGRIFEQRYPSDLEILGIVNEETKIALLERSLALVVTSKWDEPFGLTTIEAMRVGTAVVGYANAISHLIDDGVTGFVTENGDLKTLSSRVLELINDSRLSEELGKNCINIFKSRFSEKKYADKLEKIIDKVAKFRKKD